MQRLIALTGLGLALSGTLSALSFTIDYRYDIEGFFSGENAWRRAPLEGAALALENLLQDEFTAIQTGGGNAYDMGFYHPGTDLEFYAPGLDIAADTLLVFAGALALPDNVLAYGGPGWYENATGSNAFLESLHRGQGDVWSEGATDFGSWGGAISFDSEIDWYFDDDVSTLEAFPGQFDLYTVALHELIHLLGLGTAESWFTLVGEDGLFHGAASSALNGEPVPVSEDGSHWGPGIDSTTLEGEEQAALLAPYLSAGQRKEVTALDLAGLADLGYEPRYPQVPEPRAIALLAGLAALALGACRRRR
ncbi:MAG: PEP-CTERM sorting domain-containing protein [Verrucomicrobiota bacterium JB022]|nr:PEP-CTERM sorting domain-containing protein [Verrucomicrobiota bacterium JB022]